MAYPLRTDSNTHAVEPNSSNRAGVILFDQEPSRQREIQQCVGDAGYSVTTCSTVDDLLSATFQTTSAVVVLSGALWRMLGLVERLQHSPFAPPILILSETEEFHSVLGAFRSGVTDVMYFQRERRYFLERLSRACEQDQLRAPDRELYRRSLDPVHSLTRRERQVMACIVTGQPNRIVASKLGISERTVEVHRQRVMSKMDVASLAELVHIDLVQTNAAEHLTTPVYRSAHPYRSEPGAHHRNVEESAGVTS